MLKRPRLGHVMLAIWKKKIFKHLPFIFISLHDLLQTTLNVYQSFGRRLVLTPAVFWFPLAAFQSLDSSNRNMAGKHFALPKGYRKNSLVLVWRYSCTSSLLLHQWHLLLWKPASGDEKSASVDTHCLLQKHLLWVILRTSKVHQKYQDNNKLKSPGLQVLTNSYWAYHFWANQIWWEVPLKLKLLS
jgi:hypothetical protein